ncbi:uncharacterized protein [Haliotis cracherodii]|uniref:uncharacterized protein n=1 Tax=Haliotis cracherodii TaxID=6455 RepID=UPI0039EBAE20
MPRLSGNERQQAIGRLQAGQCAQVVANAFNVNVRTIYRLQHRHTTTNTTDIRPRSGRPRVTTPRQDQFMIRQHLQNRFQMATETAWETIGNHQHAISDRTVRPNCQQHLVPPSCSCNPSCEIVTDRPDCNGPGSIKIGINSNGEESSSLMKVATVFQRWMAESGSGEGGEDNSLPHTARVTRDFLQQHNIQIMPRPALSPDLNPIEHLWDEIQCRLNNCSSETLAEVDIDTGPHNVLVTGSTLLPLSKDSRTTYFLTD